MEETITSRRKVLIGMTATVGAVGVSFAAVPFIASWNPSAKAKAVGGPVRIDVSKMQIGQKIQVSWRKQPIFIIRHSKEAIENLSKVESKLDDPNSFSGTGSPKALVDLGIILFLTLTFLVGRRMHQVYRLWGDKKYIVLKGQTFK